MNAVYGRRENPICSGEKLMRPIFITVSVILLVVLEAVASRRGVASDWSVAGEVLTPQGLLQDGVIKIRGDTIAAVGRRVDVGDSDAVVVKGVILPGFIDLHDHLTWNVLPRWLPGRRFANRYEWQDAAEYDRLLVTPHAAAMNSAKCEVEIYAEVKALAGGATSVLGGLLRDPKKPENARCVMGLARNLDTDSGLIATPLDRGDDCATSLTTDRTILDVVDNEVFPLELLHDRMDYLLCKLGTGGLHGLVIHLSEGAPSDSSAHREFTMLNKAILSDKDAKPVPRDGLNIIHGTALRDADFVAMKKSNVGLIWSPRSNDELYGATTNMLSARIAGVDVAIAPDWSPSGSAGMLQELGYASRRYDTFSSSDLVDMATKWPARMVRIADSIGTLEPAKKADFVVLNVARDSKDPLKSAVQSSPAGVMLVVVGGQPLYGDPQLLARLLPKGSVLDKMTVCGAEKAVYLGQSAARDLKESFDDIVRAVNKSIAQTGESIPDIECD
jgi:5-methylthioadenosine/S-adenosylhomocysteine deaminase